MATGIYPSLQWMRVAFNFRWEKKKIGKVGVDFELNAIS